MTTGDRVTYTLGFIRYEGVQPERAASTGTVDRIEKDDDGNTIIGVRWDWDPEVVYWVRPDMIRKEV